MIPLWVKVAVSVFAVAFAGLSTRSLRTTISTAILVGLAFIGSL